MTKTTNYQLNQWAKSDRVMMDDFNADNEKIDAALAARNCRFYTASYKGNGELKKTWTFPAKPIMLLITGRSITVMVQGFPTGITQFGSDSTKIKATWHENSVTWEHTASGIDAANSKDDYSLFAILEAE